MSAMIEVELRSFVSEDEFARLLSFFAASAKARGDDEQVTFYFNGPEDLRIQQNKTHSKVWLKKGKLHDDAREEIEIKCAKDDFARLESLFLALGYTVNIKWFRKRKSFDWNGITVTLDDTKGYGKILELELLTTEAQKDAALRRLKECFNELRIAVTPKEEFERKFAFYKENWKSLIS